MTEAQYEFEVDKILRDAELKRVAGVVYLNKELILSPLRDFGEFQSLDIPQDIRVGEMGSSQHNSMVFDLKYKNKDNSNSFVPVVVKEFDSEALSTEILVYNRLKNANAEFPYFDVAFYLQAENKSYLATGLEPNLVPLSTMLVAVFKEAKTQEELIKNFHFWVGQGAISLLRLHRVGVKHGDSYPKNIGTNTLTNRTYAFDFEQSEVTEDIRTSLDQAVSLTEIRHYLDRCLRFSVEGDLTDGKTTPPDILRQIKHDHKLILNKLGVTDPSIFMDVKLDLLEKIYELYDESFVKPEWTSSLEIKTSLKLLGRYPSDSGVDYDEFVNLSIGNAGSLF